jgi:hypothetical protein
MNIESINKTSYISSWLLGIFIFALLILLGFSELFQSESQNNKSLNLLSNPIRADILANLKTIRLKNRLGSYTLTSVDGHWILKEPRLMPANSLAINKILNSLKSVNIHTVHEFEPINISNFSLDNPIMAIELFSELDEQFKINIGLINPINNTSYMTVSEKKTIFQTDILKNDLQSMELADFIDSYIFSVPLVSVLEFEIFQRGIAASRNKLTKKQDEWKSKKYNTISKLSVDKKITSILKVKTHMIIDTQNEKIQTFIQNYMDKPLYTIKLKSKNKDITYKVSSLINAISDLKLEKRQYFLMTASDRKYTYVIQKEYLNNFQIRYSDLK